MPLIPYPFAMGRLLCLLILSLALPSAAAEGEAEGEAPESTPPAPQAVPAVVSPHGPPSARLSMLLHADLRLPRHDSGLESTVLLRRARLQLDSTLAAWLDARMVVGDLPVRESQFIKDAWLDFRFRSWLQLRVGKMKTPFSHEWLMTSSNHLDFVENSLMFMSLVPQYSVGAALHGKSWQEQAEYWVGYFNGEYKADGKLDGVDQRMLVARLSISPSPLKGLQVGASATRHVGDRDKPWTPRWTSPTGYKFLEAEPTSVWTPRSRLGVEAVFRRGPLALKSEYVYLDALGRWQGTGEGTQGMWARGFYASSTWVMTGEDKTERGVTPQSPFEPAAGRMGLGAWELGVRYGLLESNLGSGVQAESQDGPIRKVELHEATLGLNWYPNAHTRWMVNVSRYVLGSNPEDLLKDASFHEVLLRVQFFF